METQVALIVCSNIFSGINEWRVFGDVGREGRGFYEDLEVMFIDDLLWDALMYVSSLKTFFFIFKTFFFLLLAGQIYKKFDIPILQTTLY